MDKSADPSLFQAFPKLIRLPMIERPYRSPAVSPQDVTKSEDLPSRLFFGDLKEETFQSADQGWEVMYEDPKCSGWVQLQYAVEPTQQLSVHLSWFDIEVVSVCSDVTSFSSVGAYLASSYPQGWDESAKERFASYNLQYVHNQEGLGTWLAVPDGFFRVLLIPVPVRALKRVLACHEAFAHDETIAAGISGDIRLVNSFVNYVEGKNDRRWSDEWNVFFNTFKELGVPTNGMPITETAKDGSRAITVNRFHYLYRVTFALRDMDRVVKKLVEWDLLSSNDEFGEVEGFPVAPEYAAVIVQSGLESQPANFHFWDKDRSRRTSYYEFCKIEDDQKLDAIDEDPETLIDAARKATLNAYDILEKKVKRTFGERDV